MPPFAGSIPAAPAIFVDNGKSLFYFVFLCDSGSRGTPSWYPVLASSNNLNRMGQEWKPLLSRVRVLHRVMQSTLALRLREPTRLRVMLSRVRAGAAQESLKMGIPIIAMFWLTCTDGSAAALLEILLKKSPRVRTSLSFGNDDLKKTPCPTLWCAGRSICILKLPAISAAGVFIRVLDSAGSPLLWSN